MEYFTDRDGNNKLPGSVIKELILGEDFMVAWYTVCIYIMRMDLQTFHVEMMNFQDEHKRSLIMAGRGFGKSYLLNTAWTLTIILRDPHVRIAIATQSLNQSKKFVREMKLYFEKGSIIYSIFGDLKGDIWTETQFSLKRERVIKEATVSAGSIGASANFISSHFDILILDDTVGEEDSASKTQRDKLKNFIFNTVLPTLETQNGYGWIHCIGTHYHSDDFWTTLINSNQYSVLKKKSVLLDKKGNERSIWEWKKSIEELKKIRELTGSIIFNMQYQQKTLKAKGNIFKPEWLQYFQRYEVEKDGVYVVIKDCEGIEERIKVRLYAGCDLATSLKTTADFFCMVVIGVSKDNRIFVLDMVHKHLTFNEQIEAIKSMGKKFTFERIGIETVAYQNSLHQEMLRVSFLPVIKINAVKDKVTRMNVFSGQFENYKVYFNQHMPELHIMEQELLDFPEADHDDCCDGLEIAWQTAMGNAIISTNLDRSMFPI